VYCGFGIEPVLEVAHLDLDSRNCDLDNLAILCPTCHRMHDIDLIPTAVVRQLRDEKRKPRWNKLTKHAARKAVATKRKTPGLLEQAAKRALATKIRTGNLSAAASKAAVTRERRKRARQGFV
jgi:hypothetical protein